MMIGDDYRALYDWARSTREYRLAIFSGTLPALHLCKLAVIDSNGIVVWTTLHGSTLDEASREITKRLGALA